MLLLKYNIKKMNIIYIIDDIKDKFLKIKNVNYKKNIGCITLLLFLCIINYINPKFSIFFINILIFNS